MERAGGDAAERNALHTILLGQFQTGTVAGSQQALIFRDHTTLNDGADGMQDIVAGQIVGFCDFGLPSRFLMALAFHELGTIQPELDARKGMDTVVDAGVARHIAARHAAVGGVDNGAALQPGDIALPEIEIAANRLQISQTGDARVFELLTQVFVLHGQKLGVDDLGAADVHQRSQHPLLLIGIRRNFHAAIAPVLVQQPLDEKYSFFSLVHLMTMYDMTRVNANGYFDSEDTSDARFEKRKAMSAQRTVDYKNGTYALAGGVVDPLPEDAPQFVKDYYAYYKTERGYHPRSLNSNSGWNVTSSLSFMNMPILQYSHEIRSAMLLIHGEKAHSCYFSRDAFEKLTGDNKELLIIPGAVHTDLYDRLDVIPFDKMESFFRQYMG